MPSEPPPTINESAFVLKALGNGLRMDGRDQYEQRRLKIDFAQDGEYGWVQAALGETRVVVQVSAEVVKPLPDRPYEGFLVISSEISPMASASYEAGRASEEEIILTRLLEKALRRSNAVDREALCIVAGQRVWSIRVDIHFLNDDGNLLDCASIGAMTALKHFRKPDVTVVGEEVIIHSIEERAPVPLAIHHSPFCLTFAFFGESSIPLLDPTHLETSLASGLLTLTLNAQQEICVLSKMGGSPLSVESIMRVVGVGMERAKEVDGFVKERLKEVEVRVE